MTGAGLVRKCDTSLNDGSGRSYVEGGDVDVGLESAYHG